MTRIILLMEGTPAVGVHVLLRRAARLGVEQGFFENEAHFAQYQNFIGRLAENV